MTDPSIFNILLAWPFLNILVFCYQILSFIGLPYALGFSIIMLTIIIRLVLYPLTAQQLKASKKMQDVGPKLSRLKERHKGDSKTLQQETMKLYKEHGINPASGCLPILVQIPIIWGLYNVLSTIVKLKPNEIVEQINKIVYFDQLRLTSSWDTTFFGLPLGKTPSDLLSSVGLLIILIPLITGLLQFVQSKMLFPSQKGPKTSGKKESDFAQIFQTQTTYIFPIMIGFLSYTFPLGLSLYWNTFTVFGIIQQYKMQGPQAIQNLKDILKR
ncbi:MAG: YidC/Oxa1 family membrane protein insertase [Candidatus Levybacteria bacterium]|nr:YidC/Oxa1 family membrane protein insertase [Candidatus Levybacteria bacterium]